MFFLVGPPACGVGFFLLAARAREARRGKKRDALAALHGQLEFREFFSLAVEGDWQYWAVARGDATARGGVALESNVTRLPCAIARVWLSRFVLVGKQVV